MAPLRDIVDSLGTAADAGEAVVLATVARVVGSSYGGVGTRMVARVDGSTVGLVSGGCLESDLAHHARDVHAGGRARVVTYDTRADDDAVWGLGLGCNGLIDVLLEPLAPADARQVAALLDAAQRGDAPQALATVIRADPEDAVCVGAHALLAHDGTRTTGTWTAEALAELTPHAGAALAAGRRGLVVPVGGAEVALEVVAPIARLVVCGSGPDAAPVVRLAAGLGWDVTVVDHRDGAHAERFPGARVASCAEPAALADTVPLGGRAAAVVMSHHLARDTAYVQALLAAEVAYVGVLGPRARTERMLADLASRGVAPHDGRGRLYAPVGLDLGGDGPDAIALAVVAEASAVLAGRDAGHLRDRRAPLHSAAG